MEKYQKHCKILHANPSQFIPYPLVGTSIVGRPQDETSSWWWQPPMSVCKLCWPLLRAGMTVLDHFFCKMYFLYVSWSRRKNLGNFFLVLPPETALFSERVQISGEVVPISREGVLHSFLMPRCMGCSEINKINRHLICSLLPLTSTSPYEKRPLTKTAVTL